MIDDVCYLLGMIYWWTSAYLALVSKFVELVCVIYAIQGYTCMNIQIIFVLFRLSLTMPMIKMLRHRVIQEWSYRTLWYAHKSISCILLGWLTPSLVVICVSNHTYEACMLSICLHHRTHLTIIFLWPWTLVFPCLILLYWCSIQRDEELVPGVPTCMTTDSTSSQTEAEARKNHRLLNCDSMLYACDSLI